MSDRLALANAIEDAGIPRDKAQRMASVIVDLVRDSAATKADVQASESRLKTEIAAASLRAGLNATPQTQTRGTRRWARAVAARTAYRHDRSPHVTWSRRRRFSL